MKEFACKDVGKECDWKTSGQSDDEIMKNVQEHGREHHGIKDFTEELKQMVRSKIHEMKAA